MREQEKCAGCPVFIFIFLRNDRENDSRAKCLGNLGYFRPLGARAENMRRVSSTLFLRAFRKKISLGQFPDKRNIDETIFGQNVCGVRVISTRGTIGRPRIEKKRLNARNHFCLHPKITYIGGSSAK